jgi:hypothetical protein
LTGVRVLGSNGNGAVKAKCVHVVLIKAVGQEQSGITIVHLFVRFLALALNWNLRLFGAFAKL